MLKILKNVYLPSKNELKQPRRVCLLVGSRFFYSIILVCPINLSQRTLDLRYKIRTHSLSTTLTPFTPPLLFFFSFLSFLFYYVYYSMLYLQNNPFPSTLYPRLYPLFSCHPKGLYTAFCSHSLPCKVKKCAPFS